MLVVLGALLLVATTVVLGASSSQGAAFQVGGGRAAGPTVTIGDTLSPRHLSVAPGTTVTWVNEDDQRHRMRSQDAGDGLEFDSGNIEPGQRWSHTFRATGEVSYSDHEDEEDRAYFGMVMVERGVDSGAGGSGGGSDGGAAAAPMKASVAIGDNFGPRQVTIAAGGTVTWTNNDGEPHTATADDRAFDSGNLDGGQRYTKTFNRPGTYSYSCTYHPDMTGVVKVVDSSGQAPPSGGRGGDGAARTGGDGGAAGGGHSGGGHSGGGTTGSGSGGDGGGAPAPGAEKYTVKVTDSGFAPTVLNARVGDQVTWVNTGQAPHTVTGGPWDAEVMPGQSFTTVLRQQGSIDYVCTYHPDMKGTVTVAAAPAGAKLPPPSADTGVSGPSPGSMGSTGARSGTGGDSGESAGAPAPGAESHTITITNNAYDPDPLQARVGDEVTWVNEDPIPHTVTGGPWDEMIGPGESFTTVLTQEGTIDYLCTLHPGMSGTLEVAEALPGTKTPPASSTNTSSSSGSDQGGHSGASSLSAKPESGAQNHVVNIVDFGYDPEMLEANVGDTVTFVNKDAAPHTATATDKSFDSGNLNRGDEWTLKLEKVGTFEYLCTYHPNMIGTLVVKPKGEETAPAPAASDSAGGSGAGGSDMASTSAGQIAGFGSGWLALLAFLAGLQLQSRFTAGRRTSNTV